MIAFLIGINHESAPVEVREKLDLSRQDPKVYLKTIKSHSNLSGVIVLSTCNRVEIYATAINFEESAHLVKKVLRDFCGDSLDQNILESCLYEKKDREAITHLFRVASSLDSLIIGEPQILGQVKSAYFLALEHKTTDVFLDKIFQKAFSIAKKIRTETKIGALAVSISYAAIELAKKIFENLHDVSAMVIGAGEMAELCALHLNQYSPKQLLFVNRTYSHSARLAQEYKGLPVEFDSFEKYLPDCDVVIVSTGASQYIVDKGHIEAALDLRKQRPMFIIDISVPRNVNPNVDTIEGVYLYNIDDLKNLVDDNVQQRKEEARRAEILIESETRRFTALIEKLRQSPIIRSLYIKYDQILMREYKKLDRRLHDLPDSDRLEIKKTFESLLKKLIHDPIFYASTRLSEKDVDRIDEFNRIFGIGVDVDDEEKDAM